MMMASLGRGSGEWIRLRRRWGTWRIEEEEGVGEEEEFSRQPLRAKTNE